MGTVAMPPSESASRGGRSTGGSANTAYRRKALARWRTTSPGTWRCWPWRPRIRMLRTPKRQLPGEMSWHPSRLPSFPSPASPEGRFRKPGVMSRQGSRSVMPDRRGSRSTGLFPPNPADPRHLTRFLTDRSTPDSDSPDMVRRVADIYLGASFGKSARPTACLRARLGNGLQVRNS
jgi:hypothetical protein